MARIKKYHAGILGVIKHNIREFRNGTCPINMEVDPERTKENYSIIRRGNTAKQIDRYRRQVENECFHYNRKNIVRANEVVCTLPTDCPPDQEKAFFEESFRYICSTLPMGEKCVFLAEVHCDEGRVLKDGAAVVQGAKHLHVMYVPAVPDAKHEAYQFKLCSDALTKRPILKKWHANYQKWMDDAGVHAIVASGVTSGRGISVKSLKEISKETGLSLDQIKSLEKENQKLHSRIMEKEQALTVSRQVISEKDSIITHLKEFIAGRDIQLQHASEKLSTAEMELSQAQDKIKTLESKQKAREQETAQEHVWGSHAWGSGPHWGSSRPNTYEGEKLW